MRQKLVLILVVMLIFSSLISCAPNELPAMENGVRLAVIGDFGEPVRPAARVAEMVKSWNPDAVVTVGDNIYPSGDQEDYDKAVYPPYAEFIDRCAFFPALGNHDWGYPYDSIPFAPEEIPLLLNLPCLPGNGRYYSVSFENLVEIFVIDSDKNEPDGRSADSIQGQWLKNGLEQSTAVYQLVFMHEPVFSSCLFGDNQLLAWPYRQWGADAVFAGHCHDYERVMKDGFPYFINGLGGAEHMTEFREITEGSTVRYIDNFGAQMIEATNEKMTISFVNIKNEVIDMYEIYP